MSTETPVVHMIKEADIDLLGERKGVRVDFHHAKTASEFWVYLPDGNTPIAGGKVNHSVSDSGHVVRSMARAALLAMADAAKPTKRAQPKPPAGVQKILDTTVQR